MSRSGASSLADQRVTVMGLGLFGGGAGAARWAAGQGARVTVTDQKEREALGDVVQELEALDAPHPVHFALGGHRPEDFEGADLVIVNPAVPPSSPWIERARVHGAQITSAMALLLERNPARVVAVTGTHGKSSTATFTKGLLERALPEGERCLLGGNIGGSLLENLDDLTAQDVLVLELSSYQLEHLPAQTAEALDVAAITNVGVDHLERHGSVERYREAKLRILDLVRADGSAIVPCGELAELTRRRLHGRALTHGPGGDFRLDGSQVTDWTSGAEVHVADASQLRVRGDFQRKNLTVALAASLALGAKAESLRQAVPHLTGLSHRMESLGEITAGDASFEVIDNGVSTTPESTLAAVESLDSGGPAILVAGGQAKRGVDLEGLARELARSGDWLVVPFGAAAADLGRAAREAGAAVDDGPGCESAEEAAQRAMVLAERGRATTVLFSPACASFDRYANFRERAMAFRGALPDLAGGPS